MTDQQKIADEQAREALRREHKLRQLTQEEEGMGIAKLPGGVYGFSYAPGTETPVFNRRSYHSFEIHKRADDSVHLVGYVTQDIAQQLFKKELMDVRLFPDLFGDATELVTIPYARLVNPSYRPTREDGNPQPFHVSATDLV